MFLVGILSWWYDGGLVRRIQIIKDRFRRTFDSFSIGILFKTLLLPYKQISANNISSSALVDFQAIFDKLISRVVGFFARSLMIIVGFIMIIFQIILSGITMIFWIIIPILPIAGIVMAIIGWVPKWIM